MIDEQLEFDFGPDFPKEQVRRDDKLQDILMDVEIAIARGDYAVMYNGLLSLRYRAHDMFWGTLKG